VSPGDRGLEDLDALADADRQVLDRRVGVDAGLYWSDRSTIR
jgi:hypothetical protein